ncbi:sel1 repeat family protein [Rugamonas sp. CCM 8940]|nr:sel1 repeat family protein [Rugamonas sp. CCM 8940]
MAIFTAGTYFLIDYLQERALHALPYGFKKFNLSDPPPACGRWKAHMPATRDPATYRLYIEARKVWRSKIAWQFTHEEATRILTDVRKAADLGDWGARALMAHFYLYGLGVLESNHVLDADPDKAVEIARMAAKALQPWGLYDLGVAYEHGYGGAHYDADLAWAYYLKAAELGSPEAQMALASAYAHEGRLKDEETMVQCAYQQGHGPAAFALGIDRRTSRNFKDAVDYFYAGVKFGSKKSAVALHQLFDKGHWITTDEEDWPAMKAMGFVQDTERSRRYKSISDALEINPDLKLNRLDKVLPLPPAKLPEWSGVDDAVEPESTGLPTY